MQIRNVTTHRDWFRYQVLNGGIELLEAEFVTHVYERHFHEKYAIGVTLWGVQRFRCGRRRYDSVPGDVMIIRPGESHDGESGTRDGYSYLMVYVGEATFREASADGSGGLRGGVLLHDAATAGELANAWRAMSAQPSSLMAEEHFVRVLNALAYARGKADATAETPPSAILARVREYIHERPDSRVSLSELAAIAAMSRFKLTRCFQRAYGLPLHAYHLQVRLHEAKRRLTSGESIASVAVNLGFSDQSHLHRRFRAAFGLTPGQWRAAQPNASRFPLRQDPFFARPIVNSE